jgi:predicted secreted protein
MVLKAKEEHMTFLKKLMCFFCGVALAIVMTDCALSNPQGGQIVQGSVNTIIVTEKDNGNRFELNTGDILTLKLECTPGTGYSWHIAKNDGNVMELQGEPVYETPERKLVVGGVEYVTFRFKALKSGTNVLKLNYKRGWEKEKEPLKTFVIDVTVK